MASIPVDIQEVIVNLPPHRAQFWNDNPDWEKKKLRALKNIIKPDSVIVDIGAEQGDETAWMQLLASRGSVIPIEPTSNFWPTIRTTYEANDLPPPQACFAGFASNDTFLGVEGAGSEIANDGWPNCSRGGLIEEPGFSTISEHFDLYPQITIDELCQSRNITPDIICCDVEGYENFVIDGAASTIGKHHPILMMSIHPEFLFRIHQEYAYDLRNRIKAFGYDEEIIDYQHELHVMYKPKE